MSRAQTGATMGAALAALLLSILDQTIVTSAAGEIARDLHGGVGQVPWLVAAYALASTCVQPLYGKLADRLGPRRVFLATLGLFLAGSALCAAAASLGELIAFRTIQGLGGGGLMSVTIVALAHLRNARDDDEPSTRGNLLGATLVGIGLVLGPTVGGQIVEHLSWQWVFLVNLPLGGAAWIAAFCGMRLPDLRHPGRVDAIGSGLLAIVGACLLLVCQWGGGRYAWSSWQVLGLAAVGIGAVAAFIARQFVAAEPLFPVRVIALHNVRVIAALQLLTGIGMTGGAVYLTVELQLVHGYSPGSTGLRLLPMAIGLALGSLIGRRLLSQVRTLTRAIGFGSGLSAAAFAALAITGVGTAYWTLALLLVVLGAGIGIGLGSEVLVLQQTVEPQFIGVATAGVRFVETLGAALAASGLAVLFNDRIHQATPDAAVSAITPVFVVCGVAIGLAGILALMLPLQPGAHEFGRRRPAAPPL